VYTFEKTDEFDAWQKNLDRSAKAAVTERILLAETGRLGKLLKGTGGISEIAMDTGPGYRLYYCREANTIYWLLVGGVKKDQTQDLKRARSLHEELKPLFRNHGQRGVYGKAH
jgi:putative addiction module killer protein